MASSSCDLVVVSDQLGLEAVDEALGAGVVIGITNRTDGPQDAVIIEGLGVIKRCVLAARIAVMNERDIGSRLSLVQRHLERVEHEVGSHVARELPADDLAAVSVDHEAEKHQALPAAQIGEVSEPHLIRAGGLEVTLHPVWAAQC
jgi:hypothetical protein